ncbi:hypothetical protein AAG906_016834 [Vitis piasezkii]
MSHCKEKKQVTETLILYEESEPSDLKLQETLFFVINFVDYSLNQGAPAGHESVETPIGHESNGVVAGDEEAMNFMSYVAEVSRGWDEPNARDMGRMTSQPNAKGEMYILNNDIDMKAKIAAMARRLEELEMKKMQEVQAISQTPLQAMPCAICLSYEHLGEECPTIPTPPQYQQLAQAPQQASNLEQAMMNLNKIDNLQDSISRFANLNTVQEKENSPSQPYQNSMSIHIMEAKEENLHKEESQRSDHSRSGKEVDLHTCKLEHKVESETEKEKRRKLKERKGEKHRER